MHTNFKNDTLFCGVSEYKIKQAKPTLRKAIVKEWFFHQRERTSIYYKKDILKLPPPWTKDEVLSKYKFVNTKRTWDRQTKWLLENVIFSDLPYEEKLLNCILFRVINKGETIDLLGGPIKFFSTTIEKINNEYRTLLDCQKEKHPTYVFFSAAYILGGPKVHFGKSIENIEGIIEKNMVLRMIKFVFLHKDQLVNGILSAKNQMEVASHLSSFKGIGSFLSYQMFVDMTYIQEFPFTEHQFVVSGPGCARGLNWLFQDKDGMTDEECLFWFTQNQFHIADQHNEEWNMSSLFHFLPPSEQHYTLMDMENSGACEIDKRCRTIFSNKRPKQKYK